MVRTLAGRNRLQQFGIEHATRDIEDVETLFIVTYILPRSCRAATLEPLSFRVGIGKIIGTLR